MRLRVEDKLPQEAFQKFNITAFTQFLGEKTQ